MSRKSRGFSRRRRGRCTGRGRRGLAAVEAALVFPVLMLLLLGTFEYGWLFLKYQQITNAARHGARVAILPTPSASSAAGSAIAALMSQGGMGGSSYTVDFQPADPSTAAAGATVTVTISVPYANIDLGMPLVPLPTTLQAVVSMAKEGPS